MGMGTRFCKRKSTRIKNGYKPCQQACQNCWFSQTASTHKCNRTGRVWPITAPINCLTPNVVYKILCKQCPEFIYNGKTMRRFKDRVQEHRGYVTQKKLNTATGAHFNLPGHTVSDLIAIAYERVLPGGDDALLERRESMWINTYDSIQFGANTRE